MDLTYTSYLELDRLLDLQHARSDPPEHDEMLFIVIHQVYELWFKLLLHEMDRAKGELSRGETWEAAGVFKRVRMVLKTLVGQVDILETMTPMSFASFRNRLESASGFQSVQFRELEFMLGHKRPEMMVHVPEGSRARKLLERRLHERSIVDHLYDYLARRGAEIPEELRAKPVEAPTIPSPQLQDALVRIYLDDPAAAGLLELMTDIDEGLQEWRYRHVKMVERTIGNKMGTGGSSGVDFLKRSLFKPVFPDLWAIRDRF